MDNRHPTSITKTKSFEKDSERRDLTINALGLDRHGTIIDYQNGIEDLKNQIVKAVGNAQQRFIEDSLRIIRVARFAAKFGFKIEPATRQAMIELGHLVDNVAGERIHDELIKISGSGTTLANYLEHLDDTGILQRILPEIHVMHDFEHTAGTHPEGGVFKHTMAALRASQSNDPVTNLAILFHDVGKPVTRGYTDQGSVSYKGHETAGLPLFDVIANRLKFSNEEKKAIKFAMEHHMKGHRIKELNKSKILALRQNPNWHHLANTMRADDASRGEPLFDPKEFQDRMDYIENIYKSFGETQEFEKRMSALVDGKAIMLIHPGIKGQDIGRIKSATREYIISKEFDVSPEEVRQFISIVK